MEKYSYCRVVALHQENIADVFTFYFYNDQSRDQVDKVMADNFSILKFKRVKDFRPVRLKESYENFKNK